MRRARPTGRLWSVAWPARPALVHRALRWAGETRGRCGRSTRRNTACLRPDLLSALPSCLRRLPPVCPQAHRQTIPLRPTIARTAQSIDYAAYVVRRGAYGRTVVRRGPYRPSSAIAHPITAVWWSAGRITDIALPITAVRSSADRITDGPSSAAALTGLSSADVAEVRGDGHCSAEARGRELGPLPRRRKEASLTSREPFSPQDVEWTSRPRPFAPTWSGDASLSGPFGGLFLL